MKEFIMGLFILMLIFITSLVSAELDKIKFNFENTTDVTKIMNMKLMDQPCYATRFGQVICYQTRMVAEIRPDDYTRTNSHKIGKNVGDRFCVEWSNLSSNQDKFDAEFCVVIEEDMTEVNSTPEGIEVKRSP